MPNNATPTEKTPILKVITEYCAMYVTDDPNTVALAAEDMPLYARRMWGLFRPSIPLFTKPCEMQEYLLGTPENPNLVEPKYSDYQYEVAEQQTASFDIELGEDFIGYELFCCRLQTYDEFGNIILSPTTVAAYNSETGVVTITASEEAPVEAGTVFDMDFYTDGYFVKVLSPSVMKILGYCFQVVWQTQFNNDWLSNIPKIEDRSFTEQNRANKMNADTNRLREMREQLAEEMRAYEQSLAYKKAFPFGRGLV